MVPVSISAMENMSRTGEAYPVSSKKIAEQRKSEGKIVYYCISEPERIKYAVRRQPGRADA